YLPSSNFSSVWVIVTVLGRRAETASNGPSPSGEAINPTVLAATAIGGANSEVTVFLTTPLPAANHKVQLLFHPTSSTNCVCTVMALYLPKGTSTSSLPTRQVALSLYSPIFGSLSHDSPGVTGNFSRQSGGENSCPPDRCRKTPLAVLLTCIIVPTTSPCTIT